MGNSPDACREVGVLEEEGIGALVKGGAGWRWDWVGFRVEVCLRLGWNLRFGWGCGCGWVWD